jgi:hypothetical protein
VNRKSIENIRGWIPQEPKLPQIFIADSPMDIAGIAKPRTLTLRKYAVLSIAAAYFSVILSFSRGGISLSILSPWVIAGLLCGALFGILSTKLQLDNLDRKGNSKDWGLVWSSIAILAVSSGFFVSLLLSVFTVYLEITVLLLCSVAAQMVATFALTYGWEKSRRKKVCQTKSGVHIQQVLNLNRSE